MAPISFLQKPAKEGVVLQPASDVVCLKTAQFEEQPLKAMKNSRIMRCSSVSSEEEQSFLYDRYEYQRSLVSIKKTTFAVRNCTASSAVLNTVWPGVSSGLDDDERRVKVKEKLNVELEEKKEAVENDDDSSTSTESSLFEYSLDEKYTLKGTQVQLFNGKCETKAKEFLVNDDVLLVPYSVQESVHCTESVEVHTEQTPLHIKNPLPSPDSAELKPKEDSSSSEDGWAEVQVEELNLEDVKSNNTKQKSTFRRHAVRKKKRSIWLISPEPDPSPVQRKRKKTCRTVNTRKHKQQRIPVPKRSFPGLDEIDDSVTIIEKPLRKAKRRTIPTSPVREEPRDSGVHSGGHSSGCGGGDSSSCSSSSGSYPAGSGSAGGSGAHGSGGGGNDDGDDGKKGNKYPWWYLPGGENDPAPDRDKEEEDEKEDRGQEKMEVDIPTTGFQMFLPSKVDNAEQCHSPGRDEPPTIASKISFFPSDLQHAAYCSNSGCQRMKCKDVKSEMEHMQAHQDYLQCSRCVNTRDVVQQHTQFCRMKGCRVPDCETLRKGSVNGGGGGNNANTGQPVPRQMPIVPAQVPRQDAWVAPRTLYCTPLWNPAQVDGKVIFRNSTVLPETYFWEHIDYNVNRKDELGGGSNGKIYPVYLRSDRSKKMVVKETNYRIPREEVEVYRILGEHEHIVKHYGGTFKGSEGHASIFMEKCDESLFHYMEKRLKRRLSVEEAMFVWPQVVDAVNYLHSLPEPVIHKDIKAKNVLLTKEYSRAKLADFDSAKRVPDEYTEAGLKPLGTKGFASPEVLQSRPHGRPADVYSLGCLLIELVVGVPSKDTLQEKINRLRELDPDLAKLVEACVKDCPEERPTARSLLELPVVRKFTRT